MEKTYIVPLSMEDRLSIHSGDYLYLTGTIYTARDAAHQRMWEALKNNEELNIFSGSLTIQLLPSLVTVGGSSTHQSS